ncbi:MAG: nickel transporter permease [Deinococcota bacterium]|uniref:Binding-protein-dependent transport systems inner membrane component n=1 Tax=Allomeiothermus silvanus (strain ATCC 700542 / DSM 9946 / NBRC 106475 / NCIMB 13440 / VI-R2) TaxID=526227 RepID=D7BB06_ALLS1|nr:nickel transporter permease [Allomeiothermus silvanus]ADH64380.1 binding-protein-dependent transport systems inner membrane component [Allomeiothermus silvanus DSM 9946]
MALAIDTPAARRSRPLRRFVRNKGGMIGLGLLLLLVLVALLAPVIAPNPIEQNISARLQPPSAQHLLGTDQLGRDVWARVAHGAGISLRVGFGVVILSVLIGVVVGLLAGTLGGAWDNLLMRFTDIFFAFPSLILAMAIAAALGPNLNNTVIAVALVSWPIYARLVRANVLALREREYVEAARAVGASSLRLMLRHLLPNTLTPIFVQASFDVGGAILTAAGLSFIGFGAQPPTPEWGAMVSETRNFIAEAIWAPTAPAVAILLTVLAFNLLGDALRDVLDPRARD